VRDSIEVLPAAPAAALALRREHAPPAQVVQTTLAGLLAGLLADVLGVETVPVDAHVFEDLGADSMVMARFCARVRKRDDLPSVSIKDVYQHPTIAGLAAAFTDASSAVADSPVPAQDQAPGPARAGTAQYVLTGVLQALIFVGYSLLAGALLVWGYGAISDGEGAIDTYLRTVAVSLVALGGLGGLPILVKWVLIGRWKVEQFPVWSLRYVRFWIVKTMVQRNPLLLLINGTPMYPLYLRALGAKVGRNVLYLAGQIPVATDLLTIGDGTVIRKDVLVSCYRAHNGLIQTGPVTLGRSVVVGEASVLDIGTSMGNGAQLGHRSSLQPGQAVPGGQSWHGSPGRRADVDYRLVPDTTCSTRRKVIYSVLKVLGVLFVEIPLGIGALALLLFAFPGLSALLQPDPLAFTTASFYLHMAALSATLYFGGILVSLVAAITVPRVLNLFMTPDRVYPLYGFHYSVQRMITRRTSAKNLLRITGNSNYVVPLLQGLGYNLGRVVQTGANFGEQVKHDNPYLTSIGSNTMVADGLSVMNAEFSSTSFTVSQASIGAHSFLGNMVNYPAEARTGDNVLLATKVMVPIDGQVREGVGLLGSPPFEIPRTVMRDATLGEHVQTPEELARLVAAKRRHNQVTMALFLLSRWATSFIVTLIMMIGLDLNGRSGLAVPIAASTVLSLLFSTLFLALVERAVTGFRPLRPRECSMYDPAFWQHERFWKLAVMPAVFNGTPFKNIEWRLLGVRVGRLVFDDGMGMPERTLVTIGDRCTFNAGSIIQCHSQEDGGFKLDRITIGAGVTLGVGSWVHYGVTMGDGSELGPDAFLMKGSEVAPGERWSGNPAEELRDDEFRVVLPALPSPADGSTHDDARDDDDWQTGHDLDDMEEFVPAFPDGAANGLLAAVPPPRGAGRHLAATR
jgi:non-ribosomal peptide synthetase-like protein